MQWSDLKKIFSGRPRSHTDEGKHKKSRTGEEAKGSSWGTLDLDLNSSPKFENIAPPRLPDNSQRTMPSVQNMPHDVVEGQSRPPPSHGTSLVETCSKLKEQHGLAAGPNHFGRMDPSSLLDASKAGPSAAMLTPPPESPRGSHEPSALKPKQLGQQFTTPLPQSMDPMDRGGGLAGRSFPAVGRLCSGSITQRGHASFVQGQQLQGQSQSRKIQHQRGSESSARWPSGLPKAQAVSPLLPSDHTLVPGAYSPTQCCCMRMSPPMTSAALLSDNLSLQRPHQKQSGSLSALANPMKVRTELSRWTSLAPDVRVTAPSFPPPALDGPLSRLTMSRCCTPEGSHGTPPHGGGLGV